MVIMARICRPYWWFGLGPAWPGRRQTPTGRPQPQITRRVKIDKQGHDRQSACKVPTLSGCCKAAPASAPGPEAERRRRPVGNRPTGYKITLSIQLNKWLEHDGLAVRCSAPGDADGCSNPWRSGFVNFADPAALVRFQVFPPALREARVRFPRLLRGIGSNNVIIFV